MDSPGRGIELARSTPSDDRGSREPSRACLEGDNVRVLREAPEEGHLALEAGGWKWNQKTKNMSEREAEEADVVSEQERRRDG